MVEDINESDDVDFEALLIAENVDLAALRKLSRSKGGFQDRKIRLQVWAKLLGINKYKYTPEFFSYATEDFDDRSQVQCDVDRSLWSTDITVDWGESRRDSRRSALSHIITTLLCRHRHLHYYQGLHDVITVFMLVCEDDYLAYAMIECLSLHYISDFMKSGFEDTIAVMDLLWPLLEYEDKELYRFFECSSLRPYFITSWLLTWFSHDVKDIDTISRIFDVLICSPPIYVLYMCAAVIIRYREEILAVEQDFALIHSFVSKLLDRDDLDFEDIIQQAEKLMTRFPPHSLKHHCDQQTRTLIAKNGILMFQKNIPALVRTIATPDWKLLLQSEGFMFGANKRYRIPRWRWMPSLQYLQDELLQKVADVSSSSYDALTDTVSMTIHAMYAKRRELLWTIAGISGGLISYSIMHLYKNSIT